jgi:hypothetical protein
VSTPSLESRDGHRSSGSSVDRCIPAAPSPRCRGPLLSLADDNRAVAAGKERRGRAPFRSTLPPSVKTIVHFGIARLLVCPIAQGNGPRSHLGRFPGPGAAPGIPGFLARDERWLPEWDGRATCGRPHTLILPPGCSRVNLHRVACSRSPESRPCGSVPSKDLPSPAGRDPG